MSKTGLVMIYCGIYDDNKAYNSHNQPVFDIFDKLNYILNI